MSRDQSLLVNETKLEEQSRYEYGRIMDRGPLQIAAAQPEKDARLKEAFGISELFEDARTGDDNNVDTKKYPLFHTPSPSPTRNVRAEPKKKKKTKRNKRERTESPCVPSRKKT